MKLSIITINYNNAVGLQKTIDSIVTQSYTDFEYIVIDGGSTDGSIDIIKKYADRINYWVSESDNGLYNAMNKGVTKAKGQYLHFLNSGDYFVDSNVLLNVFQNKSYDVPIIRGNQITDFKTHTERWVNFGNRDLTLYDFYISSFHHQATFFEKSLFEKYGLYNEEYKIVSDWEFSLKAILGGEKSIYIDLDIIVYEHGGTSSDPNNRDLVKQERRTVLEKLVPKYILSDYDRMSEMEKERRDLNPYYVLLDFISKNKFPYLLFRIVNKIYRVLNIAK